jgi:hypothetical protein
MKADILYILINKEGLKFYDRICPDIHTTPHFVNPKVYYQVDNRHAPATFFQPAYKAHIHRYETRTYAK